MPLAPGYLNGVDVASYQESANLATLPGDFVFIKATEGAGGWQDPALASNLAEVREGKKRAAFYHFARFAAGPDNTAEAEARSFIDAVKTKVQPGDVVALDVETFKRADGTVEDPTKDTDKIYQWLDLVRTALRCIPIVYLNGTAIDGADWTKVEAEFPLWYASYVAYTGPGYEPKAVPAKASWASGIVCRQYTSSGKLEGYAGAIDLNVWYQVSEWDRLAVQAAPVPTVSAEEVFSEMIQSFQGEVLRKFNLTIKE